MLLWTLTAAPVLPAFKLGHAQIHVLDVVAVLLEGVTGLYVTQTLNSLAIYPIVCLLLYTSQALALYQPEARADHICD